MDSVFPRDPHSPGGKKIRIGIIIGKSNINCFVSFLYFSVAFNCFTSSCIAACRLNIQLQFFSLYGLIVGAQLMRQMASMRFISNDFIINYY